MRRAGIAAVRPHADPSQSGGDGPPSPAGPPPRRSGEAGFSLIEVIVATVIAIIAVLGLAHSFGAGRALINRYESARDALALCQRQMETLAMINPKSDSLAVDSSPFGPYPVAINANVNGQLEWVVTWMDDPFNGVGQQDYKRADVMVFWQQGTALDTVRLSRNFLTP